MCAQLRSAIGLLLIALALAGCRDEPITEPPPGGGTPGPEHVLRPGQVVYGIDSVAVGAPEGALASEVTITIERAEGPPAGSPLPPGVNVVGRWYRLWADGDMFAAKDQAFIIGLPVPPTVPRDRLAIAVLVPAELVLDAEDDRPDWSYTQVAHDAPRGLLLSALAMLSSTPLLVAIVSADAFAARAPPQQAGMARSLVAPAAAPVLTVYCGPEFTPNLPERCGAAEQEVAET